MSIESMAGVIGASAAVALTPLILRLLRKSQWLRHDLRVTLSSEQQIRCQRIHRLWIVPWLLSTALVTWALVYLFRSCAEWMRPPFDNQGTVLDMSVLGWVLMSFFPAIGIGPLLLLPVARLVHGDAQYKILWEYADGQQGLRQVRGMAVFLLFCLLADAALLPLASGYYFRVGANDIALNSFLRLQEEVVPPNKVARLQRVMSFKAPAGNIVRRPYFEITFTDREPWLTKDWILGDLRGEKTKEAIDQIARMTGMQIETFKPFPLPEDR